MIIGVCVRVLARCVIVRLAALAAVAAAAGPALAHNSLVAGDPARDATIAVPPQRVTLTFREPVSLTVAVAAALVGALARRRARAR